MTERYPLRVYYVRAGERDIGYQSRHRTLSGAIRARDRLRAALRAYPGHLMSALIYEYHQGEWHAFEQDE